MDCVSCKMIGAGGCFAGALYVMYERNRMAPANKNRHWLLGISLGLYMYIYIVYGC